jgi:hypothetical protein
MSLKAKIRPATAPAGSRMIASVNESHTSSSPRRIASSRSPRSLSSPDASVLCRICSVVRATASVAGTPVIRSAASFQSTTRPSRSTATIPSAMFARIATLRSRSSATRW